MPLLRGKPRLGPRSSNNLTEAAKLICSSSVNPDHHWSNSSVTGKPYVSFYSSWNTAREQAGLKDVRVHDLRHSFASLLVNQGRTLYEVQKILGHTQVKTTQRYAHLSHDTLLDATNSVNTALSGMLLPMVSASPAGQVQLAQ
jgi:integrase